MTRPYYKPGSGKTGRVNPTDKRYHPDGGAIAIQRWANTIILRHAAAQRKAKCQFVCEWAERLEMEEKQRANNVRNGNPVNTKETTTP
jgi:hypothetical protein